MTNTTLYPGANTKAQWYAKKYPGDIMPHPNVLVLHTTEGSSFPDYSGGAVAPTFTVKVGAGVRQHFPVNMSARALKHGPVATNTLDVAQVEIVGTCTKGGPGIYWPEANDAQLKPVAELVAWLCREWPIPLTSTSKKWAAYPSSYGEHAAQRMSVQEWIDFKGICGHQHVPGNDHGDPGNFPIERLLTIANAINRPAPPKVPGPVTPPVVKKEPDVALTDNEIQKIVTTLLSTPVGAHGPDGGAPLTVGQCLQEAGIEAYKARRVTA